MKLDERRLFVQLLVLAILILPCASAIFRVSAQPRQKAQPAQCPVMKVTCPTEVHVKDKLTFSAELRGGDANVTPTYNWSVSAGAIESGQGTSTVIVDTDGVDPDSTVTATVEAGGFDRACGYGSTANSCTSIVLKKIEARKLDEFGALKPKDEEARLDNFAIELNNDPSSQGYILSYGTRTSRAGDAQKTADRLKLFLVSKRSIERSRLVTVAGGSREEPTVELWIVPTGSQPPKLTPTRKQ